MIPQKALQASSGTNKNIVLKADLKKEN